MINQKYSGLRFAKQTGIFLGGTALGLAALLLPACNQPTETTQPNVTTEDVTEETEQYVGQTVTVRSPIEQEVGEQGFVMQSNEFLGGESFLVLNTAGEPITPPSDEIPIQVTGEVVQFVLTDVESEYGLDLDDELYTDYEDKPAIIAQSVALAPRPEDLAANPTLYYDQPIAVEGEAGEIYSANTFSLFEEGWVDDVGLLVIGVDRNLEAEDSELEEGENVVVTGVARPFDIEALEQEYNLGLDADVRSEFEERYTDRPVIVADEIYPSAVDN